MSAHNTARLQPSGIPKEARKKTLLSRQPYLLVQTQGYSSQSYEWDYRQLGYLPSHGEEAYMQPTQLAGPALFRQEHFDESNNSPTIVIGRFKGKPGEVEGPIEWQTIPKHQVPSGLDGLWSKVSSNIGLERHHGNIAHCEAAVGSRDVNITHLSNPTDRKLVVINEDGWQKRDTIRNPKRAEARRKLIGQLEKHRLALLDAQRTELSPDGKELTIYSEHLKDANGQPVSYTFDVSCLNLDPSKMYYNPEDPNLSVKIIIPEPRQDFECINRDNVTIWQPEAVRDVGNTTFRVSRNNNGIFRLHIDKQTQITYGNTHIETRLLDNGDKALVITDVLADRSFLISAPDDQSLLANEAFKELSPEVREVAHGLFQDTGRTTVTGKSLWQISKSPEYKKLSRRARKAIKKAYIESLEIDNFAGTRVTEMRHRFVLQYHSCRPSNLPNVLDRPLEEGESVVVAKVLGSARVIHLNRKHVSRKDVLRLVPGIESQLTHIFENALDANAEVLTFRENAAEIIQQKIKDPSQRVALLKILQPNGQTEGTSEIVPLNFDPFEGKEKNLTQNLVWDSRPQAIYTTKFLHPIATAIAPQHLIDPFIMGSEVMAAIWPKVDQIGFFGPDMLSAMAFPHGAVFSDPAKNPWFTRILGTVSHSIFDAKSDAGTNYYGISGNPILSKKLIGAAMVTGPNTDQFNPVREGRLFVSRIPGRRIKIKTEIPGFYVLVIEDAEISYFDRVMFGLRTQTTTLPLSAGGGLDSVPTAIGTQRGERWNAGKCLYLMDGYLRILQDLVRGSKAYSLSYNAVTGLHEFGKKLVGKSSGARASSKVKSKSTLSPLPKQQEVDEAREWVGVGTWYWVSFAKLVLYFAIPTMILTALLSIPVTGPLFLAACLGTTLFSWPYWALQMAKRSVNPKFIISMTPKHLFWGESGAATMVTSGLDIERMGVGRFRISDRSIGNRLKPIDKSTTVKMALGATLAGIALVGGAPIIAGLLIPLFSTATLGTLIVACMPFILGTFLGRSLGNLSKRLLPNPNKASFWRSAVQTVAKNLPIVLGLVGTAWLAPGVLAWFAFPLATAVMAGGWSLFMGYNMFHTLHTYHKEQKETYNRTAPSPLSNIPKNKADTWRNTIRETLGKKPANYFRTEFAGKAPEVSPQHIWRAINGNNPAQAIEDYLVANTQTKEIDRAVEGLTSFLTHHNILDSDGNIVSDNFSYTKLRNVCDLDTNFAGRYGLDFPTLYSIMSKLTGIRSGILKKPKTGAALANVNTLIMGEELGPTHRYINLYEELSSVRPPSLQNLEKVNLPVWYNPASWLAIPRLFTRQGKIARLERLTRADRQAMANDGNLKTLESIRYDRLCEFNRLVLEESLPEHAPRRV